MSGKISIEKLKPHPKNDFYFSDVTGEKYEEIKRSIATYGIRDPLKVTTSYTIISGHQRYKIAKELGFKEVPVEIVDVDEWKAEYLLIAENIERRGEAETNPIRKARIAQFLKEYWGVKRGGDMSKANSHNGISQIAKTLDESITNTHRLLKLNSLIPELQSLVSSGKLGTTAAEQLAYLTEDEQKALFEVKGESISDITVNESKKLREEIEKLRAENLTLKDTLESIKNSKQQSIQIVKEVIPSHVENELNTLRRKIEQEQRDKQLLQQMIGRLEDEKKKLQEYINSDEYKLNEVKRQEEILRSKAHISIFELQIKIQNFIKDAAPSIYLQGAMAYADWSVQKELLEAAKALEGYVNNLIDFINVEKSYQNETKIIEIN